MKPVVPTKIGSPDAEALTKTKYLSERFLDEANPLDLLYQFNPDAFYYALGGMSNIELYEFCGLNTKFAKLCASRDFWLKLLNLKFRDYEAFWITDDVSQLRKNYYDYNFADRLLKLIGPDEETPKVRDKKTKWTDARLRALQEENIFIAFRNHIRRYALPELATYIHSELFDNYSLLKYAIDTDNLDLFSFAIRNSPDRDIKSNIEKLTVEDHSELIQTYIHTTSNDEYFDFITLFTPEEILLLDKESDNCGANDLAALLDIRIYIRSELIEKALSHAREEECEDAIELLEGYDPPTVKEELDYILSVISAQESSPKWVERVINMRLREINQYFPYTYMIFLAKLIETENEEIYYFADVTPQLNIRSHVPLTRALVNSPVVQTWNLEWFLLRDIHNSVLDRYVLIEGVKADKVSYRVIENIITPLDVSLFSYFLGEIRRATPNEQLLTKLIKLERQLYMNIDEETEKEALSDMLDYEKEQRIKLREEGNEDEEGNEEAD